MSEFPARPVPFSKPVVSFSSDESSAVEEIDLDPTLPASIAARAFAYLLDTFFLLAVTALYGAIAYQTSTMARGDFAAIGSLIWSSFFFYQMASIGYFTIMIGGCGQSLGKMVVNIRIKSDKRGSVSYGTAFIRSLGYFVSASFFYIGFLLALFDDNRQSLHDKMAGTLVLSND